MRGWHRWITAAAALIGAAACGPGGGAAQRPPSLLLVVLDTTRRDAVSAYGAVDDTTPYLDSLAREGLLYQWALAPSPWTLPSHATLFTSLGAEHHGVGVAGRMVLGERFTTLAETLRDAGYQTAAFSENPLVVSELGLAKGFDVFVGEEDANRARRRGEDVGFDVVRGARGWAEERDPDRPFFVFVNLFDPHDPYVLRESNPFLAASVDRERAAELGRGNPRHGVAEFAGICARLPSAPELEILRALYLDEVRSADAKLAAIHRALRDAADGRLIAIVTADHGEHFGEHRLLGHEFSVRSELLRVPLVVHGLPDAEPASIEARVGLRDIAPSLVRWAGLEAPPAWTGRALPVDARADAGERLWLASFSDARRTGPKGTRARDRMPRKRLGCSDEDRVFGELLSLVRFPYKLVWTERLPPQLYDLRWDAREMSDLAAQRPALASELEREVLGWREKLSRLEASPSEPLSPQTVEALRALGYVE